MATIVETVVGDRRLSIANEEIVRKMSFGARWRRLQIGIRYSITGTSNVATYGLYLGVCGGNDALKAASVVASFGASWGNASATMTYNAGPPAYFSTGTNPHSRFSKIGSTLTQTGITSGGFTPGVPQSGSLNSGYLSIQIVKDNNLYTVPYVYYQTTAQAQVDMSIVRFLQNMDSAAATNVLGITPFATAVTATAIDIPMDRAFVYWNSAATALEISDFLVVKHA